MVWQSLCSQATFGQVVLLLAVSQIGAAWRLKPAAGRLQFDRFLQEVPADQATKQSARIRNELIQRCGASDPPHDYVERDTEKDILPEKVVASRCDGSARLLGERFVLLARHSQDVAWAARHLSVPFFIYHSNDPKASHTCENIANEANPYLTFIAEYYDCLPNVTLFIHAHRKSSTHSVYNVDYDVNTVRWEKVPGYATLHRYGNLIGEQYDLRNLSHMLDGTEVSGEEALAAYCPEVINGVAYRPPYAQIYRDMQFMAEFWDDFYKPEGLGRLPQYVHGPMSAQFFVTRNRIQERPRSFYLKLLQYLIDKSTNKVASGVMDDHMLGAVLEKTWHIIFGMPANMDGSNIPECELFDCEPEYNEDR